MKMSKTKQKQMFRICLFSKDGSGPREVTVAGERLDVNHRGDLIIMNGGASPYVSNHRVMAAFKSGSWSEAYCLGDAPEISG